MADALHPPCFPSNSMGLIIQYLIYFVNCSKRKDYTIFEIYFTLPVLFFESLVLSLNVSPTFITVGFCSYPCRLSPLYICDGFEVRIRFASSHSSKPSYDGLTDVICEHKVIRRHFVSCSSSLRSYDQKRHKKAHECKHSGLLISFLFADNCLSL